MTTRSILLAMLTLCAAIFAYGQPAAAQGAPSWSVTAPDGSPVPGSTLGAPGDWLLVYLTPGSEPSDRLLQSLAHSWTADAAARVVFVLAGSAAAAKAHLASLGEEAFAASASWYVDPQAEAWKALGFQGPLAVAGMKGQNVDWRIDGVIADPGVVEVTLKRVLKGV